jgi:sodium/bile acid cotransporter 7
MRAFLARRWFLLLLAGGVSLACFQPQTLAWTAYLDTTISGGVAILLSAWSLESRTLARAVLRPLPTLWAVLLSYGLLPALGWLSGSLLPHRDFEIGLVVVVSVPCTLASAVIWTRMAGGNEATALLVTLLTNCTSWLATTAWLTLGTNLQEIGVATTGLMLRLFLVLVLPLALGQLMRAVSLLAELATRRRKLLEIISRLLTLAIMLKAAVEVRNRLDWSDTALAALPLLAVAAVCVGVHLVVLAAGWWSSRALGFDRGNQIAVAIASSQKTLPVALILFDAYFTAYPLAVVPMVFYHFGQLIVDTFIADELGKQELTTETQRHREDKTREMKNEE